MARNIIVCCDGTNNQFGVENTNVVRLIQVLNRDATRMRLYYDPGVGTLPEPEMWGKVRSTIAKWSSLAFGTGLQANVQEAYTYLMNYWEPGDRVFLFGFSRGAYTVRVLAAMLHALGLLPRGNENMVPYVMRLFRGVRNAGEDPKSNYWKLSHQFRQTFARETCEPQKRFKIRFLGVWDTVSSVGWVWDPTTFPYTRTNPSIEVIRHAVAIDERRAFYRQNLMVSSDTQDFKQFWFPGAHSDVGGGYGNDGGGLWMIPFQWIVDEAKDQGLEIDDARLAKLLENAPTHPWAEQLHESLTPAWWWAELFPKLSGGRVRFNLGSPRSIEDGQPIHNSALLRVKHLNYRPRNFSGQFFDQAKIEPTPDVLRYQESNR
jgi:uncharacterized protein (DUF2235 family)